MIFLWKEWPTGSLIVCGSFWPGAYDGAPPPPGYPDRWRADQAGSITSQPNPIMAVVDFAKSPSSVALEESDADGD